MKGVLDHIICTAIPHGVVPIQKNRTFVIDHMNQFHISRRMRCGLLN